MNSYFTMALVSIAALASADPTAILYVNADCTGNTFKWDLHGRDELRRDIADISNHNWNDKGKSVQVPAGYTLQLWEHIDMEGNTIEFEGQVNEDGSLVCQSLGYLGERMSDSLYSNNLARAVKALSHEVEGL